MLPVPAEILHALTVHFPIALTLVAFVSEGVGLAFRVPFLHRFSLWNLVLGVWGGLVTVVTGAISSGAIGDLTPEQQAVLALHSTWASISYCMAVAVCAWYLAAGREMRSRARWAAWALLGVACGILVAASHQGARLVYELHAVHADLASAPFPGAL